MEIDLFEREQRIYSNALNCIENIRIGVSFDFGEYVTITKEYGKLLKQLRRATRLADKTTADLFENNLDLTDKVHYDALTGIHNRRFMEENLKRILNTIARSGNGVLSVLMIDVDHFKKYNDTYGHTVGDTCLKAIAETLCSSITRADDFVARYGGEEFVVILQNTSESKARMMANKILENIRTRNIPHEKNDAAFCVTVSIGITTGEVKYMQRGEDYLKRADEALYISKQSGRNRYNFINLEEKNV